MKSIQAIKDVLAEFATCLARSDVVKARAKISLEFAMCSKEAREGEFGD